MPQIGCQDRIYWECEKGGAPNVVGAPWGLPYCFLGASRAHEKWVPDVRGNTSRANIGSETRVLFPTFRPKQSQYSRYPETDGILLAEKRTCQLASLEGMSLAETGGSSGLQPADKRLKPIFLLSRFDRGLKPSAPTRFELRSNSSSHSSRFTPTNKFAGTPICDGWGHPV